MPSEYADRLGRLYARMVSANDKKLKGQFFTPLAIAKLMATFCEVEGDRFRILDPGCGSGILTCCLIERLVEQNSRVAFIDLVVYEIDVELISYTERSLFYLREWLISRGVVLRYLVHVHDFVMDNSITINSGEEPEKFDIIISNPPYFKLSKNDEKVLAVKSFLSGQPNIYSIFMGLASRLLVEHGQLIFITPRSFASGLYFQSFRSYFLNAVQIDKIHLFKSRKETFAADSVLQETVIIKGINEPININKLVRVSSCANLNDINNPVIKYYVFRELVDLASEEKLLHLPISDKEEEILGIATSWSNTLADYNISISTGPVVSFRAIDFIQNHCEKEDTSFVPLFWLHNVNKMELDWPKDYKGKGQFITWEGKTKSILIPNKDYVFLRRFSTKDDKSRLIAAPYFCTHFNSKYIGVENKVNYIYRKGSSLKECEVIGLCALLNSELFDNYFQIFNGNVNVSATELRTMKFPPLADIQEIGKLIILSNDKSMNNINRIVANCLNFNLATA